MAEADRWDQVYTGEPHLYTTEPNALLVEVAQGMTPASALEDCVALADWRRIEAPIVRMVARKSE